MSYYSLSIITLLTNMQRYFNGVTKASPKNVGNPAATKITAENPVSNTKVSHPITTSKVHIQKSQPSTYS